MTLTHLPTSSDAGTHPEAGVVLLVDKPAGWTSFDVVKKTRSLLRVRKAGHAGTLDPMATGLMIVCTGRMTKEIDRFVGLEKEYEGEMMLGARTESLDAETPVRERKSLEGITKLRVLDVMREFVGRQLQVPPMWSAVKVGGRRLYSLARQGKTIARTPREITVESLHLTRYALPLVGFTVVCSKGTYVRSLVEDIGLRLGCGAFLTVLRRTRIGPYHVARASTIEQLAAAPIVPMRYLR